MIKIALVVPCKNFIENVFSIFEEHNLRESSYEREEYTMDEIILNQDDIPIEINADIILTRGLLAEILKKIQNDIPMVEISIPTADILRTMRRSLMIYGQKRIGIIAANNMLAGINGLADLIETPIRTYVLGTDWNGPALVDQALSDGCEIILGGLNTCNYADMIHADNLIIRTSKEAFWQGLTSVKQTVAYTRKEQEKSSRLQTILNTSNDGIIALDMGKRVQLLNPKATSLLHVDETILGKKVTDSPFPLEFKDLLVNNKEYTHELFRYHKNMLSISKHFFKITNIVSGTVVNIQAVQDIQALEGTIRNRIYSKGHIARLNFQDIIGCSPVIQETIETARRYSCTNSNVLLIGESGTGKEVFAQSIHNASPRNQEPFVAINCAAIPDQLLESELFGYASGAFTGAKKDGKPGLFEAAHRGTLFLDEIGEIPLSLQAKLLRVLQEREIMRIGGDKIIHVDVRIIAATNKNLNQLVDDRQFREDLFYRLDVLRVNIPPLVKRPEDIPLLITDYFRHNFPSTAITEDALKSLSRCRWPGNVRQLYNICERLAVLCENQLIDAKQITHSLAADTDETVSIPAEDSAPEEMCAIIRVLEQCHYNRGKAAEVLGISRSTLWRKMRELRLNK